jgi:hypothetical protein
MNKKTKMWLGVGVVAAAAYYFWHKSKTASFANQTGISENKAPTFMDNGNWMADGNKMSGGGKLGSVIVGSLDQGEYLNQTGSMTPCPSNPSEILVGVETGGGRRIMCVGVGGSEIHYYPTAKTPKGYR